MTWQPIETAPRDGSEILLWEKEFETYAVGYFAEHLAQWAAFPGGTEDVNPTHWMPLPNPPEVAEFEIDCSDYEGRGERE